MMSNMVVEELNKLQDLWDILIVVTKYSKFKSETTIVRLFVSCYKGVNSFLLWTVSC